MKNKQELNDLVYFDKNIKNTQLIFFCNSKDEAHVERKIQQRAISVQLILIALHYGVKRRSFNDITYTIIDRVLFKTPYEKYLSKLRGLTIVGNWENNSFVIITCYWNYIIKSRKRY